MSLQFTIWGRAVPKGRPRGVLIKGRVRHLTPKRTREYERRVREVAAEAVEQEAGWSMSERYVVSVCFMFDDKRKRDLDNLLKAVTDAMNGIVYDDDSQIDELRVKRLPGTPAAHVAVAELDNEGES